MIIGKCIIYLNCNWCHSLKEKRMVLKSIIDKVKHKFNVSIAEVDKQDVHKTIVIGFVCATNEKRQADKVIDKVINFIEENTEAIIYSIEREIFCKRSRFLIITVL